MTHAVFLVGAGLSHASDYKLPAMRGFFSGDEGLPDGLGKFLDWFYPDVNLEDYNLEEVLSFLNLANQRVPKWLFHRSVPDGAPTQSYDDLLLYVRQRLEITKGHVCPLHERLARSLSPRDTVISFNYDLLLDNALRSVEREEKKQGDDGKTRMGKFIAILGDANTWEGPAPVLLPSEKLQGFYLKLHGSVDWLRCDTAGCRNSSNIFPCSAHSLLEGQTEGVPCRYCGVAFRTCMVPPVATKRLEDTGRLAFLWNLALRELAAAEKFVVIGLSFAPSDFEVRWLVRQAVQIRERPYTLCVVNPNKSDRESISRVFPGREREVLFYEDTCAYLEGKAVEA